MSELRQPCNGRIVPPPKDDAEVFPKNVMLQCPLDIHPRTGLVQLKMLCSRFPCDLFASPWIVLARGTADGLADRIVIWGRVGMGLGHEQDGPGRCGNVKY